MRALKKILLSIFIILIICIAGVNFKRYYFKDIKNKEKTVASLNKNHSVKKEKFKGEEEHLEYIKNDKHLFNLAVNLQENGKEIYTPTYDGQNQAVHPKVLFFKNGWNGYRYWLGITPYPYTNDDFENPQILVSNNGVNFIQLPGCRKPLYIPKDVKRGGHFSDIHLTFAHNTLEVYFRYNPADKNGKISNNEKNYIYVTKSRDGRHWTPKRLVLSPKTFKINCAYLSPIINYENGLYKVWFTNYDGNLYYTCTRNWHKFSKLQRCKFKNRSSYIKIWHQDLIKTDLGYEFVCSAYEYRKFLYQSIYYSYSKDGINFEPLELIMMPSNGKNDFDNQTLYRPSLLKIDGKYQLYYSAMNKKREWHIGLKNLDPNFNKIELKYK